MTSALPRRAAAGLTLTLAAAALSGCLKAAPPVSFADAKPALDPLEFFKGRLTSQGVLETAHGEPAKTFEVESLGVPTPDGTLRIDQTIRWSDGKIDRRDWMLKRRDAHDYDTTLSDASGAVAVESYGPLLHIAYPMKSPWGGKMEQWLYLQNDGRTLINEGVVRVSALKVFHKTVARLSERITRDPTGATAAPAATVRPAPQPTAPATPRPVTATPVGPPR